MSKQGKVYSFSLSEEQLRKARELMEHQLDTEALTHTEAMCHLAKIYKRHMPELQPYEADFLAMYAFSYLLKVGDIVNTGNLSEFRSLKPGEKDEPVWVAGKALPIYWH